MNAVGHFLRGVPWQREGVERKQVRILGARQSAEPGRERSNLFIAHERAVETRGTALRHEIGDGVVHRVVLSPVVGPVVALEIERLRFFPEYNLAFGVLWRLGSSGLVGLMARGQTA